MKITAKKIRLYVYWLLFLTAAAIIYQSFVFFREYYYPAISGSEAVFTIQKAAVAETIDVEKFNEVLDELGKKTEPAESQGIVANPFK
jgi:hypothetical protein